MARTSKETSSAEVPSPGDPDRKRMLNVLAQRRYRDRKRQKIASLEAQAKTSGACSRISDSSDENQSPQTAHDVLRAGSIDTFMFSTSNSPSNEGSAESTSEGGISLEQDGLLSFPDLPLTDGSQSNFSLDDTTNPLNFFSNTIAAPQVQEHELQPCQGQLNAQMAAANELSLDMLLDVPHMKVLQVSLSIARLIGCDQLLWDPAMRWTFNPRHADRLPLNYQPTEVQKRIPHHPMMDLLPWPSVRTKLISMFWLPVEMRHPNARDPMALMHLVGDMEDHTEGFRVEGANGLSEKEWEIGDAFFRNWWWAVDRAIIENTNTLREKRGARRLRLEAAP
ncbi:hypothetical protein NA57DRAFT_79715 [Rhizodiscina lignyota]|uniref:BZIP domain-containing protein n=1 Tax=Rhizodiscina lignyota TaxID=1504668 RepID=A0A9P4I4Y5_9PEZI|nr:hypothetical protein NA57DRAFT_79715 [Rhizodiscina lignyota]